MMNKSKYKHFKSITHKTVVESNIRSYNNPNPIFGK